MPNSSEFFHKQYLLPVANKIEKKAIERHIILLECGLKDKVHPWNDRIYLPMNDAKRL